MWMVWLEQQALHIVRWHTGTINCANRKPLQAMYSICRLLTAFNPIFSCCARPKWNFVQMQFASYSSPNNKTVLTGTCNTRQVAQFRCIPGREFVFCVQGLIRALQRLYPYKGDALMVAYGREASRHMYVSNRPNRAGYTHAAHTTHVSLQQHIIVVRILRSRLLWKKRSNIINQASRY